MADGERSIWLRIEYSWAFAWMYSANWTRWLLDVPTFQDWFDILVSPASPENAINVCWLSARVLSSDAFRMVAPLMAALDAATRVKSFPVIPSRTSLYMPLETGT